MTQNQKSIDHQVTTQVVDHICTLIANGQLRPGEKMLSERELAKELDVSRASIRAGMGRLAAMGVLRIKHGVGAFIASGPPRLGHISLPLLSAIHGFQPRQVFEARLLIEGQLAALAAERGNDEDFATLAEELAEMYASVDDAQEFLIHDVRFHKLIADASGNPILVALMEMITEVLYEERQGSVSVHSNLKVAADMHREIFRAVRSRDIMRARETMEAHLRKAELERHNEDAFPTHAAKG